ncbi:uncharacterized protein L3040_003462 [Drepanopeziza brunnea f. sp. 'multigermtubi']|uniref:uncharacterized protein n=1 Tax=Drepanopeziza brunnea f. sp. 'multigermtubi' TaxID=698441 RepID=UPI0023A198F3|nr:hypothetical protein L3040_003462 [Drepanopeziza brunnea f. sp. 'multigermtubi']
MTEVSSTRLYLGNLPRNATKADVEAHFNTHGTGEITEIKLMNGFGFIEYKDAMDARDVVPAFHGSDFMGERLTVQFARGTRNRDTFAASERTAPRPRRTPHRMQISGLPGETSWQDLKDFARQSSLDVVYSETGRDRDGKGSFVEFETALDLKTAVEKLDGREFKGVRVTCIADTQPDIPRDRAPDGIPTVKEAPRAVVATMRMIAVDTVPPQELVVPLMTIHLPVADSRIPTAVTTHLIHMSMAELLMIVLHQETTPQEMLLMIMRDLAPAIDSRLNKSILKPGGNDFDMDT